MATPRKLTADDIGKKFTHGSWGRSLYFLLLGITSKGYLVGEDQDGKADRYNPDENSEWEAFSPREINDSHGFSAFLIGGALKESPQPKKKMEHNWGHKEPEDSCCNYHCYNCGKGCLDKSEGSECVSEFNSKKKVMMAPAVYRNTFGPMLSSIMFKSEKDARLSFKDNFIQWPASPNLMIEVEVEE